MTSHDTVLDVYWMVTHTPQQYGFIESADDEHGIVQLWIVRHKIGLGRVSGVARHIADHRLLNAFGPPQEAEVAGPRVNLVRVAGDQPRVEVIGIIALIAIDCEVTACVMR